MGNGDDDKGGEFSQSEFLAEEYKHFSDSFWKNESTGETRVQFFVALVTAVISALVALAVVSHKPGEIPVVAGYDVHAVIRFALLSLLCIGTITLLRIVRRNCVTDEYKEAMNCVRKRVRPPLEGYTPFPDSVKHYVIFGGLADFVAVVNGLILAAVVYVWQIPPGGTGDSDQASSAVLAFVLAAAVQIFGAWAIRKRFKVGLKRAHPGRGNPGGNCSEPSHDETHEYEVALVLLGPQPAELASEIAALDTIAGYQLQQRPSVSLSDQYWDFPDNRLQRRRFALRLRMADGRTLVTLKGRAEGQGTSGTRRREIERPWSRDALDEIFSYLRSEAPELLDGIDTDLPLQDHPPDHLEALGLAVVQQRKTLREPRDVGSATEPDGPTLAELAIDTTRYQFGDFSAVLWEVEIEAKCRDAQTAISSMSKALLEQYSGRLRIWPHSKFGTGKCLADLQASGALNCTASGTVEINQNTIGSLEAWLAEKRQKSA